MKIKCIVLEILFTCISTVDIYDRPVDSIEITVDIYDRPVDSIEIRVPIILVLKKTILQLICMKILYFIIYLHSLKF